LQNPADINVVKIVVSSQCNLVDWVILCMKGYFIYAGSKCISIELSKYKYKMNLTFGEWNKTIVLRRLRKIENQYQFIQLNNCHPNHKNTTLQKSI
jgi:hypothetical protein